MKRVLLGVVISLAATSGAMAGPIDDLSAILKGRTGSSSEDRRTNVNQDIPFGSIRIGCRGDTLDANVQITGVSGKMEGDTAVLSVTYSGTYSRQGWDVPCQRVSSDLGGREERRLSGTYSFRVTGKAFQRPVITWGSGSNFGEVSDAGHDSNVFAVRAVQSAIGSAF